MKWLEFFRSAAGKAAPVGKVVLVAALTLGLIHGVATFVLGRKVEAELRALRARGEWVATTQLAGPKIPASRNGASTYAQAFKRLQNPDADKELEFFSNRTWPAKLDKQGFEGWAKARRTIRKYDDVLATISRAAAYEDCQFPMDWSQGINTKLTYLSGQRHASYLCQADAIINAKDGNTDQAIRSVDLCLRIGDATRDEPAAIYQILRQVCIEDACNIIYRTLDYGRLSDVQAHRLSDRLAAIDLRTGYDRSLSGEMTLVLWVYKYMQDHRVSIADLTFGGKHEPLSLPQKLFFWSTGRYVGRPLIYADELCFLRYRDRGIENASLDHKRPVDDPPHSLVLSAVSPRFIEIYKARTYRTMVTIAEARTALALSVYRNRHGAFPASLDELRSSLKWQIPADPYTDKDFIYKRQGDRFVLYSLGLDGKDDGGKPNSSRLAERKADDITWGESYPDLPQ